MTTEANHREITAGTTIGVIQHGGPRWGTVTATEGDSLTVSVDGKNRRMHADDLAVVSNLPLADARRVAEAAAPEHDALAHWRALSAGLGFDPFTATEAATFLALPDEAIPGLWLALWRATPCFARNGRTRFVVRTEAQMHEELERIERRQAEEAVIERFDAVVASQQSGAATRADVLQADPEVERIVAMMLHQEGETSLSKRGRSHIESTISTLFQAPKGAWPLACRLAAELGDTDPWWHVGPGFAAHRRLLKRYEQATYPAAQGPLLEPQTDLWAIDDAGTTDRDDAVGVASRGDGYLIEVAVADVASSVADDKDLLAGAAALGTTVYLPTATLPMLPPGIGEQRHSLSDTHARPAFLLRIELDADGVPCATPSLQRGLLKIAGIAGYDEVDQGEITIDHWPEATAVADLLLAARMAQGAGNTRTTDTLMEVRDGHTSTLRLLKPWMGARLVVREAMILANSQFAQLLADADLPAPFRGMTTQNRNLIAHVDTRPVAHQGLGVSHYLYATSPIRRFADILAQLQLASLCGGDPLSRNEIKTWIDTSEPGFNASKRWMGLAQRYWKLRHLEAHPDLPLTANVEARATDLEGTARIRVMPLGIVAFVDRELEPNATEVPLRLKHVDADANDIVVALSD